MEEDIQSEDLITSAAGHGNGGTNVPLQFGTSHVGLKSRAVESHESSARASQVWFLPHDSPFTTAQLAVGLVSSALVVWVVLTSCGESRRGGW